VNEPLGAALPQGAGLELKAPTRPQIAVSDRRLAQIGLVGTVLLGLLLGVAASQTDTLMPQNMALVAMGWITGPLRYISFHLATGETMLALGLMFGFYLLAVKYTRLISARAAITAIVALNVILLIAPPLFSTDVFSYEAYARMFTIDGVNPYVHGPYAISLAQPLYSLVGAKWIGMPSAYGPLFTALSGPLAFTSIAVSTYVFKLTAALSCLGTVAIMWRGARLRGVDPVRGAVLFGLNPLVVVYGVGGGHNDLVMLLPMIAGVYAVLRNQDRKAGAMIAVATAIKLTGALVAPFAYLAPEMATGGRRRPLLLGAGVTTVAVLAISFGVFGTGPLHLPAILNRIQSEGDWHSIPGFISTAMRLPSVGQVAGAILSVVFVVCSGWLLWRVWKGTIDWIEAAAWSTVAILVCAGSLLPWYVAWLFPLVALCDNPRLVRVSLWLTGVILAITILGYFPNGSAIFWV